MKSNKLQNYVVLIVAVLLSSIIGYYCNYYFSNIILSVGASSILAIIFLQIFELSLSQLKQKSYSGDQALHSPQATQAIKQLYEKLLQKFSNASIKQLQLYTLHWQTKRYIAFENTDSFSSQHSLVYASQHFRQCIALSDEKYFTQLPEVVALDIKALLKEHEATHAIPLCHENSVYGFVFIQSQQQKLDSTICELAKYAGLTLEQVLQHDAIVIGANILSNKKVSNQNTGVPWQSVVVLLLFIVLTIWWLISPFIISNIGGRFIIDFGNVYGLVALWGGTWGLVVARQWRNQKNMSRALYMFGIGLLFQEFGQLSYAAYYFLWNISVPYPSIGDIGFFGSVLFYLAGVFFLAKASGINIKLKTFKNQLLATIVPLLMLLLGYLLFLQNYQIDLADPIRVFLDFGYPFFQAIYVSVAILIYLLTRDTKGATKNQVLLIVISLIWQFVCDYTFLFQASRGTWEVNGLNDYMYLVSYAVTTLAVLQFRRVDQYP